MLTLRPYVNSATLRMFDEKASISDRKNWWEKFTNMSVQVRNWRGQLTKHVQSSWENLSAEFRREYLKSRTSEPEQYLTMRQNALDFFYRLNEAAVKAGIKYRKSKKEREEHIKRFLKNLNQLKVVLRKQRFKDLEDLVYVLKQDRDAVVVGYDSSSSQKRDFRADNIPSSRHRPKGRAFIGLSEDEAGWDSEGHVRFDNEVEEPPSGVEDSRAGKSRWTKRGSPSSADTYRTSPTEQDIHNAVYRAMENAGWIPHRSGSQSGWQSPRPNNPDRNKFCEKCMKFGHKEHNCWIDM
ncbi:LOW QUALITY PROTEIN: hypothetical protein PHMEG_00032754, partial [Phytophthora megakarya]